MKLKFIGFLFVILIIFNGCSKDIEDLQDIDNERINE